MWNTHSVNYYAVWIPEIYYLNFNVIFLARMSSENYDELLCWLYDCYGGYFVAIKAFMGSIAIDGYSIVSGLEVF